MATRRPFQPSWVQSKTRKLKLRLWRSRLKLLKKFKLVWRVKLKKQTQKKQFWMKRQVMLLKILKPFWNNIRFVISTIFIGHFDHNLSVIFLNPCIFSAILAGLDHLSRIWPCRPFRSFLTSFDHLDRFSVICYDR